MGVIRDVIGEGLIGLGKVVGVILLIVAIFAFGSSVINDNIFGVAMAITVFIIGAGLYRY